MTEPEKMALTSMDITGEKREELKRCLGQAFPEVFAEGAIDFEQLRRVLGDWVEPGKERFGLNWPGKAECMKIIQQPSVATLKPAREESVNFDETENLFIEGDNLEVLKLLQKAYFGKVKMIYIDPPYNTGKEFIYPDKYSETLDTYLAYSGQIDDEGRRFSTNTEQEGRFHTRWLSMMYRRLYLAKNLLSDDGAIFISIDDNEDSSLRKLCDEIFGEENFLAKFAWKTDGNIDNQAKVKRSHEYVVCYCKEESKFPAPPVVDPNVPQDSKLYRDEIRNTIVKNGPKNPVSELKLPVGFPADFESGVIQARSDSWPHYMNDAIIENWCLVNSVVVKSGWSSRDLAQSFIDAGCSPIEDQKGQETEFKIIRSGAIEAIKKRGEYKSHVITALSNLGGPQKASSELEELGVKFDDYPKPTALIKYLIQMVSGSDFIVLDFFAGSATTGHAVLDVNAADNGNRKFILVQLPEPCPEDTHAFRAGYRTISDIGRDRLTKILQRKNNDLLGTTEGKEGFRSFKLSPSNFKTWQGNADTFDETGKQLEMHVEHLSPESSAEDVLYELLLKAGFPLTTRVKTIEMAGKQVFSIEDGALLICLEKEVTPELIDALADAEPLQVICLDVAFKGNDQLKANAVQTFKARAQAEESEIVFKTV